MKKLLLLASTIAGLISGPAIAQAQAVIFDGSSVSKFFGTDVATATLEDGTGRINFPGTWQTISFGQNGTTIAPSQIDWTNGDITFDYKVNSASAPLYRFHIHFFTTNPDDNKLAVAVEWPSLTPLTADGQWHTFTVPVSGWAQAYLDAVTAEIIDPNTPQQWRIFIQNGSAPMDINIDNVTLTGVIPEPSTYAVIAGLLALGVVLLRRRK